MDKDSVKFPRKAFEQGGSISITLPPELIDYLDLREGGEITLAADKSKHGRFVALWNEKQQKKEMSK